MVVLGSWLGLMILEVSSNLNDSVILFYVDGNQVYAQPKDGEARDQSVCSSSRPAARGKRGQSEQPLGTDAALLTGAVR